MGIAMGMAIAMCMNMGIAVYMPRGTTMDIAMDVAIGMARRERGGEKDTETCCLMVTTPYL